MSLNAESVTPERTAILARMRAEITAICSEAPAVWQRCVAQAQDDRMRERMRGNSVVLTGCGDSYYAGLAARGYLESMLDMPVITWPAMDVASYPSRLLDDSSLVAVSVSGKVGRTIDTVRGHNSRGGATFAVTAHEDSDLGKAADAAIATGVRGTPGPVPGTANYVGSLLGLLALGAAGGTASGSAVDDIGEVLSHLPELLRNATSFCADVVENVQEPVFAVGSGPDWGTANYAVAKLLEAAGAVGVPQDLEEWAHEQYFVTGAGRSVLVFVGAEADRAAGGVVSDMTAEVGGASITFAPDDGTPGGSKTSLRMPTAPPGLSPLLNWLPAALFALEFAERHQRFPFGIDRPGRMQTVDKNIYVPDPSRA